MRKEKLEALIKEGNELARQMATIGSRITIIKDELRRAAEQEGLSPENSKIVLSSENDGKVEVVYVSDKCVLKKGANPLNLKTEMNDATWNHLFKEEIGLNADFEDALKLLPSSIRSKVRALCEWKTQQARVSLDK